MYYMTDRLDGATDFGDKQEVGLYFFFDTKRVVT